MPVSDPAFWQEMQNKYHPQIKEMVIDHFKKGFTLVQYKGISNCRICGKWVGSANLTDTFYMWPSRCEHYIEEHNVRIPEQFVNHVFHFSTILQDQLRQQGKL